MNHFQEGYKIPRQRKISLVRVVFFTAFSTILLFGILPISQFLSVDPREDLQLRSVDIQIDPPPPPPPEPPPPEPEEQEQQVEDIQQPPQQLTLSQLETALNPGIGDALAGAFTLDTFSITGNISQEIEMFSISDLDRPPRRLRGGISENDFPLNFRTRNVKGIVRLTVMIDEQGNVTVLDVVEATHDEAVQPVRQAVSRWQFEPPTKDGKPVRAKYIQPLPYDFSK